MNGCQKDNATLQHWVNLIWIILLVSMFTRQSIENQKQYRQLEELRQSMKETEDRLKAMGDKP